VLVPTLDWFLRDVPETRGFKRDQMHLFKTCLPMFFAWAWKGLVSAMINLDGGAFLVKILVALGISGFVVLAELCPCYSRRAQAISEKGDGDTICARILVFPGHLGLSVGFAWNAVCKHWQSAITVEEPLLVFMIESVYFCVMTTLMVLLIIVLTRRKRACTADLEDAEDDDGDTSFSEDMFRITNQLDFVTSATMMESVHFVFAWGQLDLLNAFFFTYLLGCESATTCTHQSNFAFATILTIIAAQGVSVLTVENRRQEVNKAFSDLARKALGLNVGWAWANWTTTAIANAVSGPTKIPHAAMYALCVAFAWFIISLMHHRFEVERRAWDKHVEQEATIDFG